MFKELGLRPDKLHFFRQLRRVALSGHLPNCAYTQLVHASEGHFPKQNLLNLMDNIDALCVEPTMRFVEEVAELAQKLEDLRLELQRQLQLLEWLVDTYQFQELERDRNRLKQQMAKSDDRTLVELQSLVQATCDVFKGFSQSDNGQETIDFLQHFMRAGSALVNPLLQHFAQVFADAQGQMVVCEARWEFEDFRQVVKLCHEEVRTLALGPTESSPGDVDAEVWRLVVKEFGKPKVAMEREINLLLEFFGCDPGEKQDGDVPPGLMSRIRGVFQKGRGSKLEARRQMLTDAFSAHVMAGHVPDVQRALWHMGLDWAVQSEIFQQLLLLSDSILTSAVVNIEADALRLQEFRRCGLEFEDASGLHIFQSLSQHACVFEFLVEQGFSGPDCLQQFNQKVVLVRQFLEEEVAVP